MTPREIDAAVAEHVMGWKWYVWAPSAKWSFSVPPDIAKDQKQGNRFLWNPDNATALFLLATGAEPMAKEKYHWIPPQFSTDPAASKALRDKIRADGWSYRIYAYASQCTAIVWKGMSAKYAERKADTEEMSVALAALGAIGHEAIG